MDDLWGTLRIRIEIAWLEGRRERPEDDRWSRLPDTLDELYCAISEFGEECDVREVFSAVDRLSLAVVRNLSLSLSTSHSSSGILHLVS